MSEETQWLLVTAAEVPAGDAWLSRGEADRARELAVAQRRASWRLGRFAAKAALCRWIGDAAPPLPAIDVATGPAGAPVPSLWGVPAPWSLSLSHRADRALCAVGPPAWPLGCDLELVEPRDAAFVADYFTAGERRAIDAAGDRRDELVTVLWSAKESALKARGEGLRRDTRDVDVSAALACRADGWHALLSRPDDGPPWPGWWRRGDGFVLTFVGPRLRRPPVEFPADAVADRRRQPP